MSKPTPTWHMRRALRLAEKGLGKTRSNPMVGAVLVKDGIRIGEGYHERFGEAHAEVNALLQTKDAKGAELYVTLEPCCHKGKTGPCTKEIIKRGVKKVYIASLDPSEKVGGKGIQELKQAGVEVEIGLLESESKALNKHFFTYHEKKRPFVAVKAAISLDGKISRKAGVTSKLSGEKSQKAVHLMRSRYEAILVGSNTVITDNPQLTTRYVKGDDPKRIILKGSRELNSDLKVFDDDNFLVLQNKTPKEILEVLYEEGITSLMVEGGNKVFNSFFTNKLLDEIHVFVSPQILGINGVPLLSTEDNLHLNLVSVRQLGQDVHLTYTPKWDSNSG